MSDKVFLVHGYSVKDTQAYQALHRRLAQYGYDLRSIYLGRYVSLDDQVTVSDVARAMHDELKEHLGRAWGKERFHIITHSTGALVARRWIVEHYVGDFAAGKPLRNLIMLAGPHFGSRLAHHGRSMLARARVLGDTGRKILNALELGSAFHWELNSQWCEPDTWKRKGIRPFCLTGARADPGTLEKILMPATGEDGSDGVVRVPSANLNHRRYEVDLTRSTARRAGEISGVPFGVLESYEHSGPETGIMNSITTQANRNNHQALRWILRCLDVSNAQGYRAMATSLDKVTKRTVAKRGSFAQLDFRIRDADDDPIDDYSIVIGHPDPHSPRGELIPAKEIVDHTHRNRIDGNHFTFFLDLRKLEKNKVYALRITADANTPLISHEHAWFPTYKPENIERLVIGSQTTMVDVKMKRDPDPNLFVFHPADSGEPGPRADERPLHVKWDRTGEIVDYDLPWV